MERVRDPGDVIDRINAATLERRPEDLQALFHPDIVMVIPGFAGMVHGAPALIAGFEEFVRSSTIRDFAAHERQVHSVASTAVVSLRFEMVYERDGAAWRSTGRDLWVLARDGEGWKAVWRMMLDVEEVAV